MLPIGLFGSVEVSLSAVDTKAVVGAKARERSSAKSCSVAAGEQWHMRDTGLLQFLLAVMRGQAVRRSSGCLGLVPARARVPMEVPLSVVDAMAVIEASFLELG